MSMANQNLNTKLNYNEDINYLKQDKIGKVLSLGLTELYTKKPEDPIKYLAYWLKNYNLMTLNEEKYFKEKSEKELKIDDNLLKEKEDNYEIIKNLEINKSKLEEFYKNCEKTEYLDEMLKSFLPESIKNLNNINGAYIAKYEFPLKKADEFDDDEFVHLDINYGKKILQYIGADAEHMNLIFGKILPESSTHSYSLIQPEENENQENHTNNENEVKINFISDVISSNNIHYFKIPRFGSYLAILLEIKTYLNEKSFDDCLIKTKEYLELVENQKKEKEEAQLNYEERLEEAKENEEDIEVINEEFNQIVYEEIKEPEIVFEKSVYLVGIDNLGFDSEMNSETKNNIIQMVQHYKKCYESKEKKYLKDDLEKYNNFLNKYNTEEKIKEYDEIEELEVNNFKEELEEDELNYKILEIKLEVLKSQLENEEMIEGLKLLSEFKFLKYLKIIQNGFFLLQYKKDQINTPNTNYFNWRNMRKNLNEEFFDNLKKFIYKGPKEIELVSYLKINKILKNLEEIDQNDVDIYYFPLGRILKLLKLITNLRVLDVKIRKKNRIKLKEEREEKKIEFTKREEQKEIECQEAKKDYNDEGKEFNDDEWLENWENENEPVIIPPEVEEEFDYDVDLIEDTEE